MGGEGRGGEGGEERGGSVCRVGRVWGRGTPDPPYSAHTPIAGFYS